jgi:TolB-like protein/Tfp pilus assembly protein PilF
LTGRTLAHYRVGAPIGAGGMGQVYQATDTKLGRDVALKVLPEELASRDEMLDRFQREARAVAALNHPNIVTIYSVENADGIHFLTMELVEGQSLDRLIPPSGLGVDRIIAIATALSSALAAAHDKGIIHRDLKPANIMITTDDVVKVLDFGLAKVQPPGDEIGETARPTAMQTGAGVVMGTRPYMSPEQVQGRPLDHRTDIFSLGVLLYEITTGRRPFQGHSSAELFASILRDPVPLVSDVRADLPAELARVIRRCLEKDPRHRIQTARDVGNELRDSGRAATAGALVETARPASGEGSGADGADEGFRVAVLPFKYGGTNADVTALAEGMSEEIIAGLSRFSYLRIIAPGATQRYRNAPVDMRIAGREIGARYVIEGSLRQAGASLRIAVQVVDVMSGAHLWAETYNRPFKADEIFALQDDLVPRIVASVADAHGILPHTMSEALRGKGPDELTPYEAVLRSFGYGYRRTPEEHAIVRTGLERAVQRAPGYADAWGMLSLVYSEEYSFGFNAQPDPIGRTLHAARRAADAAPSSAMANNALARALFFRKEWQAFRTVADRAIELNPFNGPTLAGLGSMIAYSGDWEYGCAMVERAAGLNPRHPGYYWFPLFHNAFRKGDYREAVAVALRINMPHFFYTHAVLAAAYGKLEEHDAASNTVRELLALRPDFAATARAEFGKWYSPEHVEQLVDGLRKAGMAIADAPRSAEASPVFTRPDASSSGESRADEGFWIAVLPFKHAGGDADLAALAEGLSEEIVTGLSRFSYLRVIANNATSRSARYVMEGSLRRAGSALRVATQLVDTGTGAHLWAETYDRTFVPDAIFALQDELVPRMVSTVADMHGVLPRSMSEAVRSKPAEALSPYEAVLRSFGYFERITPEELAAARAGLESAVKKAPAYADAWAMLALLCVQEYAQGFELKADALATGLAAARRAVEAAPSSHLAHFGLAQALFFQKDVQSFRNAAERAVALNPMDGNTIAFAGEMLTYAGDRDRGLALAARAKQLNPHHPGWYWYANFYDAYRRGDDRAALDFALKVNLPGHWAVHVMIACASAQLGDRDTAEKAVKEAGRLKPNFGASARPGLEKWFDREYVERVLDGLRKAGVNVGI